jgi:hypothetical protein
MATKNETKKKKKKKHLTAPTAASIVALIVTQLTKIVEDAGKQFSARALDQWKKDLKNAVQVNLNSGQKWTPQVEKTVLRVASDMGRIAVIISDDDPQVTKDRALAAFAAAQSHKACPGNGQGAWCDF